MKNPFNIKKDIQQLKTTGKRFEEKVPLVASTSKSIFVIVKWAVFLGIIFLIIAVIVAYFAEKKEEERRSHRQACSEICNYSSLDCFSDKCQKEKECFNQCLDLPSLKGVGLPPSLEGVGLPE